MTARELKANSALEFSLLNEEEIISLLRKQEGLQDKITLAAPEPSKAAVSSFWKGHYYVSSR